MAPAGASPRTPGAQRCRTTAPSADTRNQPDPRAAGAVAARIRIWSKRNRMERPLWEPSAETRDRAQITRFRRAIEERHGLELPDYAALHRLSVENLPLFWSEVWDFCEIVGDRRSPVVRDEHLMPGARFFPEASLNFAENLLQRSGDAEALVFHDEGGGRRALTWNELRRAVASLATALREQGVVPGDRIGAVLPNVPETVVCMLAAASIGAVWSSCSPDFGVNAVLDRLAQIDPKVLIVTDHYLYAGKTFSVTDRAAGLRNALPTVEHLVSVPFALDGPTLEGALDYRELTSRTAELRFEQLPFNHPLYILYSSGTTGRPKCIVHGAGGTLLQHAKEQRLHTNLSTGERLFYFTTCGWMMWNWLVSGLAAGATLILYDGSPFHPGAGQLFDIADRERLDVFGVSAKFLDAVAKSDYVPRERNDLGSVRTILSTGSPLSPAGFEFVYRQVKSDVCLSSICGGTDLVGCFTLGHPAGPVWKGETQVLGLGMDVAVFDDEGHPVLGTQGELVCRKPFPSMPVGFWNDEDGSRYRRAYFERYPQTWHHGDLVEQTGHGGLVIFGRSDAVLNPGGVRIGTAEIYRAVERLEAVVEGLAVGQDWKDDVRVVLFVRLRNGLTLDTGLEREIRAAIRHDASPRHVPARILQVPDLPRTRSGKITELAVREVVHGRPVGNRNALANPEALANFRDRPELRS